MKKYFIISLVISLFFMGCVKDEQPVAPTENYGDIVINELITKDTSDVYFIDESGSAADWVELYNKGNDAINIAGMFITDAAGDDAKYEEIPTNESSITTIPPKGFLVLICGAADASGTDLPTQIKDGKIFIDMGLSASKDNTVAIYNPSKEAVDESADFNGLADDKSFGRTTDAGEEWNTLASKTPGSTNDVGTINYDDIVINELIAKDTSDVYFTDESGSAADWVELYNKGNKAVDIAGMFITDAAGSEADYQQIPDGEAGVTTIPPKGFLVLICGAADASGVDLPTQIKDGKVFIDMGLSASKDNTVAIYNPSKEAIDESADFNGLEDDKSFGRTADAGDEWTTLASKTPGASNDGSTPPPVEGKLVINEFMASNDSWSIPGEDPSATFPDWIEIYNTGDTDIDMGGWFATDDLADPAKYQLPADNAVVPAHGYLILMCDGLGEGLHTNFKLSGGGEAIGISKDGLTLTEGYEYCDTGCDLQNPGTDNSTGRDGDGNASWRVFEKGSDRQPTPGESNN
jgi:hypothetical protein